MPWNPPLWLRWVALRCTHGMPYGNSLATVASGDQAKGPVVVAFLQASKEPKSLARKDPRIEHDQRGISHQGMQVIEQVMASEQGPDVADSRYENQIVFFRSGLLN